MAEYVKIILDCKKEDGRHLSNWRKIKKKELSDLQLDVSVSFV
jgi:hypothetical protein